MPEKLDRKQGPMPKINKLKQKWEGKPIHRQYQKE